MHALDRRLITFVIRNRFPSKRSLKCLPLSSSLAISTSSFITMRDCRNSYNKKKKKGIKVKRKIDSNSWWKSKNCFLSSLFSRKRRSSSWTVLYSAVPRVRRLKKSKMENLKGSWWFVSGPTLEPPLPRRKKCPELAYKTHEFITAADGGGIDAVDSNVVADKVRVRYSNYCFFYFFFILPYIDHGNDNWR